MTNFDPQRFIEQLWEAGFELWALETGQIICLGLVDERIAETIVQHCAELYPLLPILDPLRVSKRVH